MRAASLSLLIAFVSTGSCARPSAPPLVAVRPTPSMLQGYVVVSDGARLFYRLLGNGPDTIVVLHGGPGFSMEYIAPDLVPLATHHVLLFYDQRGGGRSSLLADSASLDAHRFADDLEDLRIWFGIPRLVLFAHSWGAAVAALYAANHADRIAGLVVVDGIPVRRSLQVEGLARLDSRRDTTTRRRLSELRAARVAAPADSAACRKFFGLWFVAAYGDTTAMHRSRGDFCGDSPEALANKVTNVDRFTLPSLGDWDFRTSLVGVTAPVLVVHGTADYVPVQSAREWTAALPNGRLWLSTGSGHFPYVEAPDRLFAAVDEFLSGRWPAGAEPVR